MTAITNVQGFRTQVDSNYLPSQMCGDKKVLDDKVSRLTNELLMLKTVHIGFTSADKKDWLLEQGVSTKQLQTIEATRGRLLGGDDHKPERGNGTQELVAEARRKTEGKYNIMVIKAGHNYDINGISPYLYKTEEKEVGGTRYKIYAFNEGTFVNRGDGGYINWAFWGNFTRDGGTVHFKPL